MLFGSIEASPAVLLSVCKSAHSGDANGEGRRGASGDMRSITGGYIGDMSRITYRYNRLGSSLPNHYVYHKKSKNLYNYTPWNSSIYIKTVKSTNGLNFLLRR